VQDCAELAVQSSMDLATPAASHQHHPIDQASQRVRGSVAISGIIERLTLRR
jgi:hypothetical protein